MQPSAASKIGDANPAPYIDPQLLMGGGRRVYLETYGCQMNVADTEVIRSLLNTAGFERAGSIDEADVVLLNTCAIREGAEHKIWQRLRQIRSSRVGSTAARHDGRRGHWPSDKAAKQAKAKRQGLEDARSVQVVGLLGCMAERLKGKLLEEDRLLDLVCGPDAYRDLPRLLSQASSGQAALNVQLSLEETYADVAPVREAGNGVSAFVSIMRGCNNMCAYCIVPFTRGRERSRDAASISREVAELVERGVREVTVLGQNVNSYVDAKYAGIIPRLIPSTAADPALQLTAHADPDADEDDSDARAYQDAEQAQGQAVAVAVVPAAVAAKPAAAPALREGFATKVPQKAGAFRFAELLDQLCVAHPEVRFRFTSPHPKDFPDPLLAVLAARPNACKALHIPAQSGSTSVLASMKRGYDRETYLRLIDRVRELLPTATISSDFISGFCGESEADHADTLTLLEKVRFDKAFMFAYSMREKTHAHRQLLDDVPEPTKQRRLAEVIATFNKGARAANEAEVGSVQLVLVDGLSKKSDGEWVGRTDGNRRVVLARRPLPSSLGLGSELEAVEEVDLQPGDYVAVHVTEALSPNTMRAAPLARCTLAAFAQAEAAGQLPEVSAAHLVLA